MTLTAPGSTTVWSNLLKKAPVLKYSQDVIDDKRCRLDITGSLVLVISGKEGAANAETPT